MGGSAISQERGQQGLPTWFGSSSAPLFGVVHLPAGGVARGGVVICQPLGREHVDTYRGVKLLAQRLCGEGFAVLRFDYSGCGDSSGEQSGDGAIEDYVDSIGTAVQYLRDSGVEHVALVGLRVGALLAVTAMTSLVDLDAMVLWDPVTDGRKFLREQRVLYKMTAGEGEYSAGTEPILGATFSTAAAKTLKSLKMPLASRVTTRMQVLVRPERTADPHLSQFVDAQNCTVTEIAGQSDFVEAVSTATVKIPVETLGIITSWLDANMPHGANDVTPTLRSDATIAQLPDGRTIVETLEELGHNGLFAIRTSLAGVSSGGPTLLLHNTACEHRVGSGRIWPDSARELSALGMTVVRYDRRGVGDTGLATEDYAWIHSEIASADVLDATAALNVSPDNLMMTGICSGAWNSAHAALHHGAKSVVLLNLLLYSLRRVDGAPERLVRIAPGASDGDPKPEGRGRALAKHIMRQWLPYSGWLALGRLGYTQAPEVLMNALAQKGVPADLVLSPPDYEWYKGHRGPIGIARLARLGRAPKLVTAPTGDHAGLQRDMQIFIREYLVGAVQREFADGLARALDGATRVVPAADVAMAT